MRAAVVAAILVFPLSTNAADTAAQRPTPGTPRIGLALSGGGARGLAHVGVLKVLEELRVPVHCVTGTSMGAIVGATFATGMPVAEMEKAVIAADWDKIFRDQPPRAETASHRKADDYKTLFAPEYGVKDGTLALPKGVIAGVSIEAFFRTLTERAIGVDDFRKLPVPFSAVAADIETGEAVVLDRGSLAHAMRASMSVPGALAPVEVGGRLLVDGGIANNLPIDLAREVCADVVIAVNISTPPLTRDEITSALSVAAQLVNFLGLANVDRQLKSLGDRDILIGPELGNISAGSFERAVDAIRIGEAAARKMADSLRRYALPEDQYAAVSSRQTAASAGLGAVDDIRFEGLKRTNPEVLRSLLQSKQGEPLSEAKVSADLRRIYGRGDFETVDYHIEQGQAGRVMTILPREKDWGPDYLRFGLGLATDFQGANFFNILAQYRRTWLNRLGGEWLTEAQIGQDTHLSTKFIQPLDEQGRYFVSPHARTGRTTREVFIGENRVAEYDVRDTRVGLDAGATINSWGDARLGAVWRHVETSLNTGSAVFPDGKADTAGLRANLFSDQQDTAWFPRSGSRALASAYLASKGFGSDQNYKRLEGQLLTAKSWKQHTFHFSVAGGTDLGTNMPAFESFTLGGPLRLSGYRINEFRGRRMEFGRLMQYNRAVPLPDILGSGAYWGSSVEVGRMSDRVDGLPSAGTIWSGSVFLAADTFVGPLYFGIGAGEGGRRSLYLLLGAP